MKNYEIPSGALIADDVINKEGVSIVVISGSNIERNGNLLVSTITDLNNRAFNLPQPTTDTETVGRFAKTTTVLLAAKQRLIGFGLYQAINYQDSLILYQSRAIVPEGQRQGLGSAFIDVACEIHSANILSGKAQNPVSFWTMIKSGKFEYIYPIERYYSEDEEMSAVLQRLIEIRGQRNVDPNTGLIKKSYRMGKLGDYDIDLTNPGIRSIEEKLNKIGLDRFEGDALYYMGKLKNT